VRWRKSFMKTNKLLGLSCLAAGALALAGCGGSSDDGTGQLVVNLTDSPVDSAEEVNVTISGLTIKPADGEAILVSYTGPNPINLLDLQGGVTAVLADATLAAGQYEWIRLGVVEGDGTQILIDTNGDGTAESYPLWIPSGAQTGLKLVRPFFVAQGGVTELTIDFDVRKSVIAPPGLAPSYILKPTLRLVDNLLVGAVAGDVDVAYLSAELGLDEGETCDPGVYLFEGPAAIPDDQDDNEETNPLVYQRLEAGDTGAAYLIPFVEAGKYTVAFTCDFGVDEFPDKSEYNPDADPDDPEFESMRWFTVEDVTVEAGKTTDVSLLPTP
jgi:hypothetical protein